MTMDDDERFGWQERLEQIEEPDTAVNRVSYTIEQYEIPIRRLDSSAVTLEGLHNAVNDGQYAIEGDEDRLRKDPEQHLSEQLESMVEDLFGTHNAALINEEPYEDILETAPELYHGNEHDGEPRPVVLVTFEDDPFLYRHELHPVSDDTLDDIEQTAERYGVKLGGLRNQLDVHSIRNDLIIPSNSPDLPSTLAEDRGTGASMFFGDTRYLEQDILPQDETDTDLYHQVLPQDEGYQVSVDLPTSTDIDLELTDEQLHIRDEDSYQGAVPTPDEVTAEWSYEMSQNNGVYTIALEP